MKSLCGLRSHYAPLFEDIILVGDIMPFMRGTVGVSDLSSEDILDELRLQKKELSPDEDLIRKLYVWLADMLSTSHESQKKALK